MSKIITKKHFHFELPPGKKKERLDVFLVGSLENATRSRVQKLIEAGSVLVNGTTTKSNYAVRPADVIDVTIPISPRPEFAEPEEIQLKIIFEDDFLIIVDKPAGMVAHPAFGNYTGTLVNALLYHSDKLSGANEDPARPGIVHRIDKDTSGLLVVAKDETTHARLASQFSKHTIEREYWTVVWGTMKEQSGTIDTYITRSKSDRKKFATSASEGKHAVTMFTVLEEYEFLSLLSIRLKTGRTHQIRVHLSGVGHPVFGDETYGGRVVRAGAHLPKIHARVDNLLSLMPRQALHAKTLGFIHPHSKEHLRFDSELPEDFSRLLAELRKNS
jgi:23S rRNA pseudouridine1911/1915/1917 synthase